MKSLAKFSILAVFISLFLCGLQPVQAQDPCLLWMTCATDQQVSVFCVPDGSGDSLTAAQLFGGVQRVDATLTVNLVNEDNCQPWILPAEEVWLGSTSGYLANCLLGTIADDSTIPDGQTTFSGTLATGGYMGPSPFDQLCVIVNGVAVGAQVPNVRINSADINGNGAVDLSDVVVFSQDILGAYDYRSDFVWDGVINLKDVVKLAAAWGSDCPHIW